MSNVRCLHKLIRFRRLLVPLNAPIRNNGHLVSPLGQSRSYAQDSKDKTQLEDFRLREEQREKERDAAEAAAKHKQNDSGGGGHQHFQDAEQAAKQAKVDGIRQQILDAALEHVPQLGWTRQTIVKGAEQCGYPGAVHGMFPEGGFALVSHFNSQSNAKLVQILQEQTQNGQREVTDPLDFLVQAVRQRLEMIVPYKSHWPQAMALIAQPQHASTALAQVLTLVDDVCYYSGDRSVDFGWYTRRIGLATIMKMTELYLLQDSSPDHAQTWSFLKHRMDEAVQLQMMLAQTEGMTHTFQRSFNSAFITARNILGLGYNRP
ncbi:uncharacterized protein Dwil_GK17800 [Drosophila willistoni]|uniref:Ubiquinone biosynthesis protein n=1 Tax=Drosophila willistoni TaxID=7260 RepID=B4N655_DROWI|nr:ubiquinone biosynthesis protein COQ9, mitochondrial [Drosophila willistoni]EDW79844.2 uncharacterized protein Dwil_GK17800 [Drosophila willistoni]